MFASEIPTSLDHLRTILAPPRCHSLRAHYLRLPAVAQWIRRSSGPALAQKLGGLGGGGVHICPHHGDFVGQQKQEWWSRNPAMEYDMPFLLLHVITCYYMLLHVITAYGIYSTFWCSHAVENPCKSPMIWVWLKMVDSHKTATGMGEIMLTCPKYPNVSQCDKPQWLKYPEMLTGNIRKPYRNHIETI